MFSVFTSGTGIGTPGGLTVDAFGAIINSTNSAAEYYIGMEDNLNGRRGSGIANAERVSDRDYNDIVISIQAAPEPAASALFGLGLLTLAAYGKRRRA